MDRWRVTRRVRGEAEALRPPSRHAPRGDEAGGGRADDRRDDAAHPSRLSAGGARRPALCVEEEVCLTLPAHPARLVLTPQYAPRAVSRPGGPHGEGAPWVMSLSNFVSDEEAEADSGG